MVDISKPEKVASPAIATLLQVVGWAGIVIGAFAMLASVPGIGSEADAGALAMGISGVISGLLMIAAGAVIVRLHKIEYHLRPENRPTTEALPKIGLLLQE